VQDNSGSIEYSEFLRFMTHPGVASADGAALLGAFRHIEAFQFDRGIHPLVTPPPPAGQQAATAAGAAATTASGASASAPAGVVRTGRTGGLHISELSAALRLYLPDKIRSERELSELLASVSFDKRTGAVDYQAFVAGHVDPASMPAFDPAKREYVIEHAPQLAKRRTHINVRRASLQAANNNIAEALAAAAAAAAAGGAGEQTAGAATNSASAAATAAAGESTSATALPVDAVAGSGSGVSSPAQLSLRRLRSGAGGSSLSAGRRGSNTFIPTHDADGNPLDAVALAAAQREVMHDRSRPLTASGAVLAALSTSEDGSGAAANLVALLASSDRDLVPRLMAAELAATAERIQGPDATPQQVQQAAQQKQDQREQQAKAAKNKQKTTLMSNPTATAAVKVAASKPARKAAVGAKK